jgi:hypothetical protein
VLGEKLLIAARDAQHDITLIAPFIKVDALTKVLDNVNASIPLRIITRWIPAEIAAGICDLEIFDILQGRSNSELFVHPFLHAKLFRFDDVAFFGSANLTRKALGWAAPANVELLHAPKDMLNELKTFEVELMASVIRVDEVYRDFMCKLVEKAKSQPIAIAELFDAETHQVEYSWLPKCRTPEWLWLVYTNPEKARTHMVESAFEAAQMDLVTLYITPGLPETLFNQHVAAIFGRMPLVQEIDISAREGVTTDKAVELIESAASGAELPYSPSDTWEVLMMWLMHFFPQRYRREPETEVFRQGRVIG